MITIAEMQSTLNPLVLAGPAIFSVFSLCFLLFWLYERNRYHLLLFAVASILFCLGSISQMLLIPAGLGPSSVVSAFLYTLSVLLVCDGLLRRSAQSMSFLFYGTVLVLTVGGIAYFFYVNRDLSARIYILNFGFGFVFLSTLWRLTQLRVGALPEKVLFWTMLAFTSQFFICTTLIDLPKSEMEFGLSTFWLALQFSLVVLGAALAIALLAVVVSDKMVDLKFENAVDPLTEVLNRRSFIEQFEAAMELGVSGWFVIADVDYLKTLNDRYGHLIGDEAVIAAARGMQLALPSDSLIARIGGDEFCAFIPLRTDRNIDKTIVGINGIVHAEFQARTNIQGTPLSLSFGYQLCQAKQTFKDALALADQELYRKKRSRPVHA